MLFVLAVTPAAAQNTRVEGSVSDATGALIAGAQIELFAGAYSAKTTTTASGVFTFMNVPAFLGTISVTAPNFKAVQQSWVAASGRRSAAEDRLLPLASVSQQVVVTAARTSMPIGQTPVSDIQLASTDLQATPALTLDDALRQVPGFGLFRRTSSRTANPTTLGVSLRGLGANGASRALVLEDGIPLNDPFGSWVYWDRVPAAAVSSVEVAQEGASSLYGSEALGGVVQFFSRPAQPAGLSLETSYGNQNTQQVSLSAGAELGRWETIFSGEAFHTDGYILVPKADQGSVDTDAYSQHGTADLTIRRKLGEQSDIFARGEYFDDARNNGTAVQTNGIRLGEGVMGADLELGSAGGLQLRSYGNFENYHQSFYSVPLDQNSEALTDWQRVPAQGVGASAVWSRALGKHQTLVAGVDEHEEMGHSNEQIFSSTTGNNTRDTSTGGQQRTSGVFGEDVIQIAWRWTLGLSARLDDWRNFDGLLITQPFLPPGAAVVTPYPNRSYQAFSPRANLVHEFNSHLSWSASRLSRFPRAHTQ